MKFEPNEKPSNSHLKKIAWLFLILSSLSAFGGELSPLSPSTQMGIGSTLLLNRHIDLRTTHAFESVSLRDGPDCKLSVTQPNGFELDYKNPRLSKLEWELEIGIPIVLVRAPRLNQDRADEIILEFADHWRAMLLTFTCKNPGIPYRNPNIAEIAEALSFFGRLHAEPITVPPREEYTHSPDAEALPPDFISNFFDTNRSMTTVSSSQIEEMSELYSYDINAKQTEIFSNDGGDQKCFFRAENIHNYLGEHYAIHTEFLLIYNEQSCPSADISLRDRGAENYLKLTHFRIFHIAPVIHTLVNGKDDLQVIDPQFSDHPVLLRYYLGEIENGLQRTKRLNLQYCPPGLRSYKLAFRDTRVTHPQNYYRWIISGSLEDSKRIIDELPR